jgi:opacity protein-like surface antigen
MKKILNRCALLLVLPAASCISATAQHAPVDVAVTFVADRTNPVHGSNDWLKGGGIELGTTPWHGMGIAAKVTGATTSSLGSQNVPLSLVIVTFGPRYRFHMKKWSAYGEGLIGEAHGFRSVFPGDLSASDSANAFALQVGGGLDYYPTRHLGVRLLDANWTRTQFLNATTNVQNHLQLGAGLVFCF